MILVRSVSQRLTARILLSAAIALALPPMVHSDTGPKAASRGQAASARAAVVALPKGESLVLGGERSFAAVRKADGTLLAIEGVEPRHGYSASVLPDGSVLVLGGRLADGSWALNALVYEPSAKRFEASARLATARAYHSATLLTDGRLFVAGGVLADGQPSRKTLLIDTFSGDVDEGPELLVPRSGHQARLLPSGAILIENGLDAAGRAPLSAELFDPRVRGMQRYADALRIEHETRFAAEELAVAEAVPPHEMRDVHIDEIAALRFSKPIDPASFNADSVTLLGPAGTVAVSPVVAEAGMLGFVDPARSLLPDSRYSLFLSGVQA